MPKEYCIYEANHESKIATITFNRPEKLNSLGGFEFLEVRDKVIRAEDDDDIMVIVFKGAGRCFGSGADVGTIARYWGATKQEGSPGQDSASTGHYWEATDKERRPSERGRLWRDNHVAYGRRGLQQTIQNCCKATVAQVHGYCYGAHFSIAMASDIAIASEDALFTHPGYRYIGGIWAITHQMQLMGIRATKEMMLTGRAFDAREALQCGLVNKVVPLDRLEQEVSEIAKVIALMPRDALAMTKANFELAQDIMGTTTGYTAGWITHTLQTNIRYEPDEFNLLKERRDKGVKGAIEKRERRFGVNRLGRKPK